MAQSRVDIILKTKTDLSGVQQLRTAVNDASRSMQGMIGVGAKLGLGMLGAQNAVGLLNREIRHVIENIETIPGVPQDTIDSINQAKAAMADARAQVDLWIAKGVTWFSEIGQGLGYLAGAMVFGWDAATDAYGEAAMAAKTAEKSAKDSAAALREQKEALRAAEKAAADYAAAMKAAAEAWAAEDQVGESIGMMINRLNAEAARIDAEADGKPITEQLKLRAEAARRRTDAARAYLTLNEKAAAVGQQQADAEFARLASSEKLLALRGELSALDAETGTLDISNPEQWERVINLEARRLDLGTQILEVQRSIADAAGDELNRISEERNTILQNRLLDETTIRARLTENTEEYRRQLERVVALKLEERAITGDSEAVARIDAEIDALRRRAEAYGRYDMPESKITVTRRQAQSMGDPSQSFQSIGEGVEGGALSFLTQIGTTADSVAKTVSGTLNAALAGTASSIEGLIKGTMTWRQAMANVGITIATSVVSSIARMFAEWVAGMILQATVGKTLQAASVAAAIPIAAATSAIWAVPATLATIASFGGAAAQAPISIAVAKGTVLASSVAGFDEGGFTAPGPAKKPAGIVHAGEWVAPKWMVDSPIFQPMIAALEGVRAGKPGFADGGLVGSLRSLSGLSDEMYGNLAARGMAIDSAKAATSASPADVSEAAGTTEEAGRPINLTLVDSRREANRIQWNSATEDQIVEIVRRNRSRVMT